MEQGQVTVDLPDYENIGIVPLKKVTLALLFSQKKSQLM